MGATEDMDRIYGLCKRIDAIQSLITKKEVFIKRRRKRRLKLRARKVQKEIKDLKSEVHRKTAKLLLANYDVVLLPTFETGQMSNNTDHNRKINSATVRKMMTWSHYSFQQLLIAKAREAPATKVMLVDESYTTNLWDLRV